MCEKSRVQISGAKSYIVICKQFATTSPAMQVAVLSMLWGWVPQTCYTVLHNMASIMKGWVWFALAKGQQSGLSIKLPNHFQVECILLSN